MSYRIVHKTSKSFNQSFQNQTHFTLMHFFKSTIKLCYNLSFKTNKRFLVLAIFLVLFLLLNLILLNGNTNEISNELKAEYLRLKSDLSVDTSEYVQNYENYKLLKAQYQSHSETNLNYRIEIPNLRKIYKSNGGQYTIAMMTTIFDTNRLCKKADDSENLSYEDFFLPQCPYTNCRFSCDKNSIESADALLFHESDLKKYLHNDKNVFKSLLEKERDANKVWILWNDEANKVKDSLDKFKFNWTMSYRFDADISDCSYGCRYKLKKSNDALAEMEQRIKLDFNSRKNQLVWFVSNCMSFQRIELATEINKHFPVQIMGKCSAAIKFKQYFAIGLHNLLGKAAFLAYNGLSSLIYFDKCAANSKCEIETYGYNKFFLAFESKNCTGYITEKFWRTLRLGLIPVVFQPRKEFYVAMAPPDSFIHAEDFNFDAQLLGEYLSKVASDLKLYSKYHLWRYSFDVVYSPKQTEMRRLCEMCTRLNTETSSIYYKSVSKWFNDDCIIN